MALWRDPLDELNLRSGQGAIAGPCANPSDTQGEIAADSVRDTPSNDAIEEDDDDDA